VTARRLRLVAIGMMGRLPWAGPTWACLNWLRGFHRLGHEVWYVEDDTAWPYDPEQGTPTDDGRYAVKHIARCMAGIGLPDRWAFRLPQREGACWGLSSKELDDLYRACDALLNIEWATHLREEQLAAPLRVMIQSDPVGHEMMLAGGDAATREAVDAHHFIVTRGENYGAPDCLVPLNGLEAKYRRTRQPVDLELWPTVFDPAAVAFTTISSWRQPGEVRHGGASYYYTKHLEWEKFLALPRRTPQPFEAALKVEGPDRDRLLAHGWRLVPPLEMSLDVFGAYPAYIGRSRAAWSIAKHQYVAARSGWFSDREACYLASGKPVVAQDTGFSRYLPTGEGLFAFATVDEALAAVEAINADYPRHCRAARRVARECFEAGAVAARLLADVGLA
jgi:hypothetical protein